MQILKNITDFKAAVRVLVKDEGLNHLTKVLPKCFEMTEGWIEEARNRVKNGRRRELGIRG